MYEPLFGRGILAGEKGCTKLLVTNTEIIAQVRWGQKRSLWIAAIFGELERDYCINNGLVLPMACVEFVDADGAQR